MTALCYQPAVRAKANHLVRKSSPLLAPRAGGFAFRVFFFIFVATFVLIISHGCPRDDIDTEPAVAPPLHSDRE